MSAICMTFPEFFREAAEWIRNFFNPELEGYTNFEFSGGILNLKAILFGIYIGILIASFSIIFIRTTLGKAVRELLAHEALSADRALTLADIGLERHYFIRYALTYGYTLRRVIHCVESEEVGSEEKRKVTDCHFYIPEKDKYVAEMRFNNRGSGYLTFLFVVLIGFLGVVLIFAVLPQLLTFIDNVISMFSVKGNMQQ